MPQQTNLNVFPYFDDFDFQKSYQKVLFKPGYPVQARELTTLQSTLQNQIEQLGNFTLKSEGTIVIPGNWEYNTQFNSVGLESSFNGVDLSTYLNSVSGFTIRGFTSGVRAKVILTTSAERSESGNNTLYVNYIDSGTDGSSTFIDGEQLITENNISINDQVFINSGETFARTLPQNSTFVGSAFILNSGVYYIRGTFVPVSDQIIILDAFNPFPSYKVGFEIQEKIITSAEDNSLNDNSNGFLNYAAPGADRLSIRASLIKVPIDADNPANFIQIASIKNGVLQERVVNPQLGELKNEFARRTYDESGDYYVIPPTLVVRDTLNDFLGNNGVYSKGLQTSSGNTPSEELGTYQISPLKAYVKGFEIETISSTFVDFPKPRATKTLSNQELIYSLGPAFSLNRVNGCPNIGLSTSYYVSLRDSRVGTSPTDYTVTGVASTIAAGKEIGLARVYDFALESGSYNTSNLDLNQWDISLFDVQTYTEISLNEPTTLSTPTQIKGKSSGAIGFLRYDISNSGILTAYNISGKFTIGERLIFDGIENTRVSTSVTSYGIGDIKSIYSNVGSASTFSADTIQYTSNNVGQVNISAVDAVTGISTVTSTDVFFVGIATAGNLVSFSDPNFDVPTYARVTQVQKSYVEIVGVTTVSGICEGSLPTVSINPSDFRILTTKLQASNDNSLYTVLSKEKVSSVDLSSSNLTIRRQYEVTISSGTVSIPASIVSSDETFLPYDEERYVLIRDDGTIEALSEDKFVFNTGGRGLEINGLSSDGAAKLITTLRKINVKEKIKNKQRINSIIISNSKYEGSGIGNTTLNDGLTYGNYPYGTRVQDEDICLLKPDVTKIYAVLESSDTNDPIVPTIVFSTLSGPTGSTSDVIIGERILNESGNTIAICVELENNLSVGFVYLNDGAFSFGEKVVFEESGVEGIVSSVTLGSDNIGYKYDYNAGYFDTIYGYSRLVRKFNTKEPTKKIKVIFESADISDSDRGDIVTVDSYSQFDYCELPSVSYKGNLKSVSDIIDIRPRVSTYTPTEGSRSPFEFLGRNFSSLQNDYTKVLADDESININYSFYLPRIDRIYLNKDGLLQLKLGEPSENPKPPIGTSDSIELATISLPAYLCSIKDSSVSLAKHKRFRMSDIQKLEERISNLEFYTTLSLLETDTSNFSVKDENGLDRFKSGFFVDNFSGTLFQRKVTGVKNSIDVKNQELRPTHYTTELDLVIGSESLLGLTQNSNESVDLRFVEDLVGSGVRKTGQLLTLDYEEILETSQPYATKVVNVAPFRSTFYAGTIELFPASDVWIDQVRLEPTSIKVEGNFSETLFQLSKEGFDAQTGFGPVTWNSWEYTWTGESKETDVQKYTESGQYVTKTTVTTTKTGTRTREGTRQIATEEYNNRSFGDSVVSLDLIPYMRTRNIEFTAKRMKPFTRVYNFFDNVDVTEYCTPKLLEISMLSGTFIVGEIVQAVTRRSITPPPGFPTPLPFQVPTRPGIPTRIPASTTYVSKSYRKPTTVQINQQSSLFTSISITNRCYFPPPTPTKKFSFRVAAPNHKYGQYNRPSDVFTSNPYNRDVPLETSYSESSTILNVDTYSLANMVQSRFKGHVQKGMILKGVTSGATAVVTDVRLITDNVGTLIGSFNIPNPNNTSNPKFQTGIKLFRMTNSDVNTKVGGLVVTSAEERFYAEGTQTNVKENILVTRDLRLEPGDTEETEAATDVSADVSYVRVPIPPPPAPAPAPAAPSRGSRPGRPRSGGSSPNVRPVVDVYNSTSGSIAGTTVGGVTFNRDGTVSNGVYLGNGQWNYQPGATGGSWTGTNGNSSAGKPVYQTGRGSSSYSGPRSGPTYPGRTTGSGQAY
jgi:hypothetical protein